MGVSTPWSVKDLSPLFSVVGAGLSCSSILHSLPSFTIPYCLLTSRAVCSGHKLATAECGSKEASLCKLLRGKEKLVAGGGLEPPTLGL